MNVAAQVQAALAAGGSVVALESTIIAHGLPWPDNLAIGRELEAAVRASGAVPATIAMRAGVTQVGLDDTALAHLAEHGPSYVKCGATDLAVLAARGRDAATTVSATAVIAARAGIRVFATGGIGGVHRGDTGDVSHDLYALAKTPIAVISAGAKAILDLPRTLEVLESLGVLVIGFATDEFPAFYHPSSGLRLEHRCDDARELAQICTRHWAAGGAGVLVCNPIPTEAALPTREIDHAIATALTEASRQAITGKAVTPFLLRHLAATTGGRSIIANRALARHNAQVGARLAAALVDRA